MSDFERLATEALEGLVIAIDSCDLDCDVDQKGDGILEVTLTNGSKIIVNRNSSVGEIWVAAKSGGFHFRRSGEAWINTRSGEELFDQLSRCLSEQSGIHVDLRGQRQ
jgi:CyaY protein